MTRKKYRSMLAIQLSVGLAIDGRHVQVDFTGGANARQKIKPTFITSDPVLQDALEKSGGMNIHYFLESTETTPDEVVEPIVPEVPLTPVVPEVPEAQPTPEVPDVFGAAEETGFTAAEVTNAQDAKAYLNEKFPGQVGQMPNKAAVLSEANRLKVSFPNWK